MPVQELFRQGRGHRKKEGPQESMGPRRTMVQSHRLSAMDLLRVPAVHGWWGWEVGLGEVPL